MYNQLLMLAADIYLLRTSLSMPPDTYKPKFTGSDYMLGLYAEGLAAILDQCAVVHSIFLLTCAYQLY